jgi:hypothetical protein
MGLRCVYLDLDRTLLGARGSLFHDGDGRFEPRGARAIERCLAEDVEVVIVSGRTLERVRDHAALFGQTSFVFEAGTGLVVEEEKHWQTGRLARRDGVTIHQQIAERGVPELLLRHFDGDLFYPERSNRSRRVTHVLRGVVDIGEARALLDAFGHRDLQLIDNGRRPTDRHVYHLAPAGTGKGEGVRRHRELRGYAPGECIAVGDSREDLGMADHVGTFWLVANALERDPALGSELRANARVAEGAYGDGVYEAVVTTLAEDR